MCVEGMINGWTREDTNQLSSDLREEREREREEEERERYTIIIIIVGRGKINKE